MLQRMIKCAMLPALFILIQSRAMATEGMWLPHLLSNMNEKEMKGMGMKISAADIYNVNKGSLKDAIVSLGGFCTAELISSQSLLLTNHHCGYASVQSHSSVEHNYLDNGFWAKSREEELPNKGLFVTFIVRIEDVTPQAMQGINRSTPEKDRQKLIDANIAKIKDNAKKEQFQEALIKPFFEGNQFYLFITETYKDIRLVGTPPSSIGKFGSDTDNWIWPRHTGDFSLFRIYAGKDNRPAEYSKDNVPLRPKHFLPVSLDGIAENDFTMVFGFPGRTQQYLPSEAVKLTVEGQDPAKVSMRDASLKIIDGFMRQDEKIKIQYAAKYASTANAWKKWIGEMQGVQQTKGIERKVTYEGEYTKRLEANTTLKAKFDGVLDSLNTLYRGYAPFAINRDYYAELTRNVELLSVSDKIITLMNDVREKGEDQYPALRDKLVGSLESFYKDFSPRVDRDVAAALLDIYFKEVPTRYIGGEAVQIWMETNKSGKVTADKYYSNSALITYDKLKAFLNQPYRDLNTALFKDPVTRFGIALRNGFIQNVNNPAVAINNDIMRLQRVYMQAQMEVMDNKRFYPDANSTLRITYGKVSGYKPADAKTYDYSTTLDGVMEKYKPGDYEFDVPEKLRSLYAQKDYGQYGVNGKMPVCFIASNHTTGGNSGSPVLDAYGNLVGLNFDRTWEGTMSDINYDASICRNIMVDIRYVLFIVDKFAGAKNLVDEMKLVHPKKAAVKPVQKRA